MPSFDLEAEAVKRDNIFIHGGGGGDMGTNGLPSQLGATLCVETGERGRR